MELVGGVNDLPRCLAPVWCGQCLCYRLPVETLNDVVGFVMIRCGIDVTSVDFCLSKIVVCRHPSGLIKGNVGSLRALRLEIYAPLPDV